MKLLLLSSTLSSTPNRCDTAHMHSIVARTNAIVIWHCGLDRMLHRHQNQPLSEFLSDSLSAMQLGSLVLALLLFNIGLKGARPLSRLVASPDFLSFMQLDVLVLALLLIDVGIKGARPPAWLFWTLPLPSINFAATNMACLALAMSSRSWWVQGTLLST